MPQRGKGTKAGSGKNGKPVRSGKAGAKSGEATPRVSQEVGEKFARTFAPAEIFDQDKRDEWRLEEEEGGRGPYVVELNLQHIQGLPGASSALMQLYERHLSQAPRPTPISRTYVRLILSPAEVHLLLDQDSVAAELRARKSADSASEVEAVGTAAPTPGKRETSPMRYRAIYKLWPDFPVTSQMYRSLPTIKANAARLSFEAEGRGIVWAVIDSGIMGDHGHFDSNRTLVADEVRDLHRTFVKEAPEGMPGQPPELVADPDDVSGAEKIPPEERERRIRLHCRHALRDDFGHGTHVAGIIAGAAPTTDGHSIELLERFDTIQANGEIKRGSAVVPSPPNAARLHGVAPLCYLVSLKVLDANGQGRSSDVIRALEYIREKLNDNPKLLRVHGVNLSVGYEFDAEMFACGQSPLCSEVNRLVQSGVSVVAAAGNTGYGTVAAGVRTTKVGLSNTINDPGNAELAITVGATHRDAPYMYGVSYFSSKGPTGDGRLKPDLVAPGERITSCGAGKRRETALASAGEPAAVPGARKAYYVEDSGTSMAAPHVSGAIAAFLSIRREFIGRPMEVKRIFTETASPLGRERYFEGHGLLDLVRAIQSV